MRRFEIKDTETNGAGLRHNRTQPTTLDLLHDISNMCIAAAQQTDEPYEAQQLHKLAEEAAMTSGRIQLVLTGRPKTDVQ